VCTTTSSSWVLELEVVVGMGWMIAVLYFIFTRPYSTTTHTHCMLGPGSIFGSSYLPILQVSDDLPELLQKYL
jgi:hypothetical protein